MAARKNKKTTGRRTTRSSRRTGKSTARRSTKGKKSSRKNRLGGDKLLMPEKAIQNF